MKFDEIAAQLGDFGRYQKWVFYLLTPAGMTCGIQVMISVFNMGVPNHRCALPGYPNDTWHIHSPYHSQLVNASIPLDSDMEDMGGYSRCKILFHDNVTMETREQKCSKFVYDTSLYASSLISKWDLVCEKELFEAHARMVMMGGLLLGAVTTGILADKIGRKLALMAMIGLHVSSSIAVAWAPSFLVYVILRCITGFTVSGLFLVIFVIGMELVGPKKRMFVGILVMGFWAFGVIVLGVIAYFVRDWDKLQMIVSFPFLLLASYWWLIPESPRWLLARGRDAEAEDIIRRAARSNNVKLPEKLFDNSTFEEVSHEDKLSHVFTSPVLLIRTIILCFNWLVCSTVYYGLSLNSDNLGGSVYVNFELMVVVEIFAYIICILVLNRLGRKLVHVGCMLLGGGACLCTIFSVLYASAEVRVWLTILLALIGKLGAAAAFAIIYIISAELFPTILRNSLLGVTCLFARVGGMISPYIAALDGIVGGQFGRALPLLVFGVTTIVAGLLCLFLPETLGRNLPETMEDAEMFGRKTQTGRRAGQRSMEFYVETPGAEASDSDKEQHPLTVASDKKPNSNGNGVIYKPSDSAYNGFDGSQPMVAFKKI